MRLILALFSCLALLSPFAKATEEAGLVEVGKWQIGITLAAGKRTAVVSGEDSQSTFVLPSIQYYSEKLFFDNGTLGYTLVDKEKYALSAITEFNPLAAWFYRDHPDNWFSQQAFSGEADDSFDIAAGDAPVDTSSDEVSEPTGPEFNEDAKSALDSEVPLTNLEKPDWSLDVGAQLNWFVSREQGLSLQLFTDITGLHDGQRAEISWFLRGHTTLDVQWQLDVGSSWISEKASFYYFGVERGQNELYRPSDAYIPFVSFVVRKPLNDNLSLIAYAHYQSLSSEITNSPKIDEKARSTYLIGVSYAF